MEGEKPGNGQEQLAALIAQVEPEAAHTIADRLINQFGSLGALINANPMAQIQASHDYPRIAPLLFACRSAMMNVLRTAVGDRPVLSNLDALIAYLHASMAHAAAEQVRALYLDARLGLIHDSLVGIGGIDASDVDVRSIVQHSLNLGAAGFILAHNHPSGNPEPSGSDIAFTRHLAHVTRSLNITLHDHVIIARGGWASLRGRGLL